MIPARWQLYLIVAAAFIVGLIGIRSKLLAEGEARARVKIDRARLDAIEAAKEIDNEVEALDPDDLRRRATVWVRGKR